MLIKYGTGFTIALEVDDKSLDVESHSRMSVNRQKGTSLRHFLRNPTFGVVSTTERLLRMPQIKGGERLFEILSTANMWVLGLTCSFKFYLSKSTVLVYSVISQDEHKAAISVSTVKHSKLTEKHDKHVL